MTVKLDKKLLDSLKRAVKEAGSQTALCQKTGISTSIMSRYLKGEVSHINAGNRVLLQPVLNPAPDEDGGEDLECIIRSLKALTAKLEVLAHANNKGGGRKA